MRKIPRFNNSVEISDGRFYLWAQEDRGSAGGVPLSRNNSFFNHRIDSHLIAGAAVHPFYRIISMSMRRASNGIYYRIEGEGPPLLLLHGLMVSGKMFDPLIEFFGNRFQLLIPDLRGHGKSGDLPGPYDVPALAADLDAVLAAEGLTRCAVMGYSHGGAVAQQFAHTKPNAVGKLILTCTYACNTATLREKLEARVLLTLLRIMSPAAIGRLMLRQLKATGASNFIDQREGAWLVGLMSENRAAPMRGAARGLIGFDSRPWLADIKAPTLVIAGARDHAVPRHHFDTLVGGIPGARGHLIDGADHTLAWTHTRELGELIAKELNERED
jgi:3-oxoadipate enol-lactonase